MRLKTRDVFASILLVLVAIPYVGYLVNGEMPFVKDARGMSAVGLVLATVAFLVVWRGDRQNKVWWFTALVTTSLALGVVALALAETAAAEAMLGVFMASILVVWTVEMIDRAINGDGLRSATSPRHAEHVSSSPPGR
ncbi:hypothetical protein EV644_104579 [Kribbella orskensis]|uniref:SPW repeat-containing protein n=1 Tax=Kribbella orskensis TaxID=2512216 RepID=A0ABY2BR96_9ACTN|nr:MULTISPECIES: hypothetical protein [Kribbella]TCN42197.1 hypothetical protein EV642_103579 [Kribbella sp. VKM Ac-2500]TCO26075.1 hypothetical protein EV644_104579 [Kribbella orskensis]